MVHAQRTSNNAIGLPDQVERWEGTPGGETTRSITQRPSPNGESPYRPHEPAKGATIVPRCLFFVEEATADTSFTAAGTRLFNPRRGPQDKKPWKELPLVELAESTVETAHVFDVHLGETVAPYVTLPPLRAVLPISTETKSNETPSPDDVYPESLRATDPHPMAGHEQPVEPKQRSKNDKKTLLEQLDYLNKLSAQLAWQHDNQERPFRVVYTSSGRPTAALVENHKAVIDHKLYWVSCDTLAEAHYLLAVINSDVLRDKVKPFMSKGQFGPRDVHKHLWKLPIPTYDPTDPTHTAVSQAGHNATQAAQANQPGPPAKIGAIRRRLRSWLKESPEGKAVEEAVSHLIG